MSLTLLAWGVYYCCITAVIWHCHKPLTQWQCSFQMKAALPLGNRLSTASDQPWYTVGPWAPSQYPKRRLIVRSHEVLKPQDLYLELSDHSEIWQPLRQHCCRSACQISKRFDNLKYQSRGFETSRDLTIRCLFGYWEGIQWGKWRSPQPTGYFVVGVLMPDTGPRLWEAMLEIAVC